MLHIATHSCRAPALLQETLATLPNSQSTKKPFQMPGQSRCKVSAWRYRPREAGDTLCEIQSQDSQRHLAYPHTMGEPWSKQVHIGEIKGNVHNTITRERESLGICARQYEEGAPDEIEVSVSSANAASNTTWMPEYKNLSLTHRPGLLSNKRVYCLRYQPRQTNPALESQREILRSEAAVELTRRYELVQHLQTELHLHLLHAEIQSPEYRQTAASSREHFFNRVNQENERCRGCR